MWFGEGKGCDGICEGCNIPEFCEWREMNTPDDKLELSDAAYINCHSGYVRSPFKY